MKNQFSMVHTPGEVALDTTSRSKSNMHTEIRVADSQRGGGGGYDLVSACVQASVGAGVRVCVCAAFSRWWVRGLGVGREEGGRASFERGGEGVGVGQPPPLVFAHQTVSQQVFFLLVLGFGCKNG